jgi:hypothetical protein
MRDTKENRFIKYAKNGDIHSAKILFGNNNINIHSEYEAAFRFSCECGHLEFAKWLLDISININSLINIHIFDEYAFKWSCFNGHYHIVKWLIEYSNDINSLIDIHKFDEYAFRVCCVNGHMNIVKLLLRISNDKKMPIDINCCNKETFILTCKNGHLDIAKLLYEISQNTGNAITFFILDEAFIESKNAKHMDIILWLCTINQKYKTHFINKNNQSSHFDPSNLNENIDENVTVNIKNTLYPNTITISDAITFFNDVYDDIEFVIL